MEDRIINAGPVIGITIQREGEYLRLRNDYSSAVIEAGGVPVLLPDRNDPFAVAELIAGLLIPGGRDMDPSYYGESPHPSVRVVLRERTDFEIALLKAIMEFRRPVFGICYGMQMINVALGGDLYQDIESQFPTGVDHGKGNHRITGKGDPIKGEFMVSSSHHQAVKRLGDGLEVIAVSDDNIPEAIRLNGYPFLVGVQWHPERSSDELSMNLFRKFVEAAREWK